MKLIVEVKRHAQASPRHYRVTVATDSRQILYEKGEIYPSGKAQDAADAFIADNYSKQISWQPMNEDIPGNLVIRGTVDDLTPA